MKTTGATQIITGYFQFPVAFKRPEFNCQTIADGLKDADFDLLVLPEMCTTGYLFDSKKELLPFADCAQTGAFAGFLQDLSAQKQATLVAGMVERDGENLYNTAIVVSRGKWLGKQRKCHITDLEKKLFEEGDRWQCFDDGKIRFGVLICFDLWLPEAARLLALDGAKLYCCPVNYGGPWTGDIMRVRAMENGLPLVSCNRTGVESGLQMDARFCGESQIIDAAGNKLVQSRQETSLELTKLSIGPKGEAQGNVMCSDLLKEARRYTLSGPVYR